MTEFEKLKFASEELMALYEKERKKKRCSQLYLGKLLASINAIHQTMYALNELAPKLTLIGCIKAIYSNKDITVVLFDDGKKIKVKRAKDDSGSIYSAVAYALAEHIYGSNTAFKKVVDSKLRSK